MGEPPVVVAEEDAQGPAPAIAHFPARSISQRHRLTFPHQQKLFVGDSCEGSGCWLAPLCCLRSPGSGDAGGKF